MSGRTRRRGFGYVRKLPSGRWQASYVGPDLVRRSAPHTFEAKADAEGWLGVRREEVVSGQWQPPVPVFVAAPLTFDAYSAQWLRERALKPRTREGYEHLMRSYLHPLLGPMILASITPSVVRTWCARLPADVPTVRARSYAPRDAVLVSADDGHYRALPVASGGQLLPGLVVYRFSSGLYYANANRFNEEVLALVDGADPVSPVRCVVLDAAAVVDVDYSGGLTLHQVVSELHDRGATLVIAQAEDSVRAELDRYGITESIGADAYVETVGDAVKAHRAAASP